VAHCQLQGVKGGEQVYTGHAQAAGNLDIASLPDVTGDLDIPDKFARQPFRAKTLTLYSHTFVGFTAHTNLGATGSRGASAIDAGPSRLCSQPHDSLLVTFTIDTGMLVELRVCAR
jgi:hypothetical protein